jgi:hypothetical protein
MLIRAHVRFGSFASFSTPSDKVGYYPNNDRTGERSKRAMSDILHRNKVLLCYSIAFLPDRLLDDPKIGSKF